ncbi:hypothetical protein Tco_1316323 [Tanacetum coccineum]
MRTRSSLEYTIPRRRNCRRSRHRQEAIPLILDPIPMADDRPMAEQLQAPTGGNEMNEMKNMMKALVPTPAPIKAVEERCTTCGSNHSFNVCPMTRGGYESPVYHDNFQQFQQTASVGNFVQNGNSGYRPPNLANQIRPPNTHNHTHPPGFSSNQSKPSNQGNIPHQGMVPYQSPPQNSQIVLASQLDIFKKTTEGSMQVMRNHITNLKAEIRSEVQATLQNQINSLKGEFKNDQPSTSTSMVPTTLPSNTITNPRCEARAITTRSGLSYTPVPPMPPPYVNPDNEKAKETEVTKDKVQPESSQSTANVQPRVDHGKGKDKLKDNEKGMNEKEKDDEVRDSVFEEILIDKEEFFLPKTPPIIPNKPTKTLPYPSRVEYEKKGENDKVQIQKFWEMFKKIHVNITLADALILMPKPFLRTARALIDVFGEEMSLRTDEERLIISVRSEELKYTTRPHKESVCMIDIFSSPKEKDEDSNAIFTSSEVVKCDFLTTNGNPITPPFTIPTKKDLTNEKVEKHEVKTCKFSKESSSICPSIKEKLNFWKNKEVLEKNEILKRNNTCDFQTPSFSLGKKEVEGEKTLDVKTIVSFFAPIGNCVRKWATNEFVKDNDEINHEVFKSDNENVLGVHDNEEEEIAFLDGLLEDENFFEMNDKKVEFLERKTKEDFETKDEPKSKKELQVFHPDIEILNHFETTSYVGSDYVFYEDFNLMDMIFPMNIQGKIFDPGITFHEKSFEKNAFKDKSSIELAPSKALLTLDVFDPLHPPLMDFHVTKAFSGFTFSLLKIFSKKFFEPGIKNATVYLSYLVWGGFPDFGRFMVQNLWKDKAMPTISIDGLQSSLHKVGNLLSLSLSN